MATINTKEERDVATANISNTFIQVNMPEVDGNGDHTIMKLRGQVVRMLCQIDTSYKKYVVIKNGQEVLYVHITKAIYRLLLSALLFYKKLSMDLLKQDYKINPYHPCIANKIINSR